MRVLIVTALITALVGGLCVGGGLYVVTRGEINGSGNVISDARSVSGVTRVSIEGPGDLVIVRGDTEALTIRTDDNILERIETEVTGGELRISYDRTNLTTDSRIRPTDGIQFALMLPDLERLEIDGSATAIANGMRGASLEILVDGSGAATLRDLRYDDLVLRARGSGSFEISGAVERQDVVLDGDATYRAINLASREAVVEVIGNGRATVNVSETLDATVDGSGLIEFTGDPAVEEQVSGGGAVRPIDDDGVPNDATPAATAAATPASSPPSTRPAQPTATPRALSPVPSRTPTSDAV